MTSTNDLAKLVPGFDFLQGLMKGGGAALPGIGQWIAPTLDPAELGKRIDELRTVQFWLEQNAKLLGTTVQALEVQRMTLATLRGMNLPMADVAEALKVKPAEPARGAHGVPPAPAPRAGAAAPRPARAQAAPKAAAASGAAAGVDPMQWWGALTQQFTELAAKAMQEGSAEMARNLAATAAAAGAPRAAATADSSIERAMKRGAAPAAAAAAPASGGSGQTARGTAPAAPAGRRRKTRAGQAA